VVNWQLKIDSIEKLSANNDMKLQRLRLLRYEILARMHTLESYIDKVDYVIYSLEDGIKEARKGD